MTMPSEERFESWWLASKYMQVVYSDGAVKQAAKDGWNAALAAMDAKAVAWQARMSADGYTSSWSEWAADKERVPTIGRWSVEYRPLYTTPAVGVDEAWLRAIDYEISVWAGRMSSKAMLDKWPQAQAVHSALRNVRTAALEAKPHA